MPYYSMCLEEMPNFQQFLIEMEISKQSLFMFRYNTNEHYMLIDENVVFNQHFMELRCHVHIHFRLLPSN